jgi:HEAT repeat protein
MALLRPLLLDNVPSIQQSAALALGRLASYSDDLAEEIVSYEILPQLVYSLNEQNVNFPGYFIFTVTQRISINP